MDRITRRAFLGISAAALAGRLGLARAATCEPHPPVEEGDPRPMLVFLDEAGNPQGPRLDELRGRLAAHGLGDERVRFEAVRVHAADAQSLRCIMEILVPRGPIAFCTTSADAARHALPHLGGVPLVFALQGDPVASGIVDSLGMRRTNATGFTFDTPTAVDRKCLELVMEAFPRTRRILVPADGAWMRHAGRAEDLRQARSRFAVEVRALVVPEPWQIVPELQRSKPGPHDACYVPRTEDLFQALGPLVAFLQRARMPHLFGDERSLRHGAMLAYGARRLAHWDAMASMVRLIVAGVPAREIPVQRPAEFLLSVSVAQWQRLGIALPGRLLRRAHAVL